MHGFDNGRYSQAMVRPYSITLALLAFLILTGCAVSPPAETATATAAATSVLLIQPSATSTSTLTPTSTNTPVPSSTPLPSPTPLPTAVALTVTGNPRALQLRVPEPDGRYPCGMVDVFDFPVDPPDAANVLRGGEDFGVFRRRYDKYHAGEDWSGTSRASSLGTPVHSIGHGLVTYAEPLGWGRDQGVVIVEHTFEDGSRVLSFYGHLDPDSVVLRPGVCVVRGEQVGKIGRPRTVPHLHFEMRTQQPYAPLGGYWPEDPTLAGWLWPSQEVWKQRIESAPGVAWTRPFTNSDPRSLQYGVQLVGQLDKTRLLLLEAEQLQIVDLVDGQTAHTFVAGDEDGTAVATAVMDAQSHLLYLTDRSGALAAYPIPDLAFADGAMPAPLWTFEPDVAGAPRLLPLPGRGVALAYRTQMLGVSAEGVLLWQQAIPARPFDWQQTPTGLIWSHTGTEAAVWQVQGSAPPRKLAQVGGHLAVVEGVVWVAAPDGVYRIALEEGETVAEQVAVFPSGLLHRGDITALPDGGVLVAHADVSAGRLLQAAADGAVIWQGEVPTAVEGELRLVTLDGAVYLLTQRSGGTTLDLAIYEVETAVGGLNRLFVGGTRYPLPSATWLQTLEDGRLLLNIGGGQLVLMSLSEVVEE